MRNERKPQKTCLKEDKEETPCENKPDLQLNLNVDKIFSI